MDTHAAHDPPQDFDAFASAEDFLACHAHMEAMEERISKARAAGSMLMLAKAFADHPFVTHASLHLDSRDHTSEFTLHAMGANGASIGLHHNAKAVRRDPLAADPMAWAPVDNGLAEQARRDFGEAFRLVFKNTRSSGLRHVQTHGEGNLMPGDAFELARAFGFEELALDIERRSIAASAASTSKRGPGLSL